MKNIEHELEDFLKKQIPGYGMTLPQSMITGQVMWQTMRFLLLKVQVLQNEINKNDIYNDKHKNTSF